MGLILLVFVAEILLFVNCSDCCGQWEQSSSVSGLGWGEKLTWI